MVSLLKLLQTKNKPFYIKKWQTLRMRKQIKIRQILFASILTCHPRCAWVWQQSSISRFIIWNIAVRRPHSHHPLDIFLTYCNSHYPICPHNVCHDLQESGWWTLVSYALYITNKHLKTLLITLVYKYWVFQKALS